jgi:acetylornithine deacetylase/succinyl-diaminopimelate desuccinylase-like protein
VRPPGDLERQAWARLPFHEEEYLAQLGTDAAPGEEGYSVLERRWVRPTLEVHGIAGGFTGPGSKTVIPAQATAKVSMRLVPDQRPAPIYRAFEARVRRLAPPGVRTAVRALSMADPVSVAIDAPVVQAAAAALEEVFGARPVYIRAGGTGPVVIEFVKNLGIPAVLVGFGLPDDRHHAPNERFFLPNFYRGIEAVIAFMERMGADGA